MTKKHQIWKIYKSASRLLGDPFWKKHRHEKMRKMRTINQDMQKWKKQQTENTKKQNKWETSRHEKKKNINSRKKKKNNLKQLKTTLDMKNIEKTKKKGGKKEMISKVKWWIQKFQNKSRVFASIKSYF